MLTYLARKKKKKTLLFGSTFVRTFYIGNVFRGSVQCEGSDLLVLTHKTVKYVSAPFCSQKGGRSLTLQV